MDEGTLLLNLFAAIVFLLFVLPAISAVMPYLERSPDIPGVGPSAAEKIDKIMLEFWRDNPQEEEALAASK